MATISVEVHQVARLKAAMIAYYNLDSAISNADLMTFAQQKLGEYLRSIVKSVEADAARNAASDAVDVTGVAS